MAEGSLINLGDLSKPATVLIEKVSDAVGGIAKPWQIKRVANAEAEAEKIRALAQVEITDIQQRALARMIREEGVKQENIEAITAGAIPHLDDEAKPESIDQDWLSHFFEKARIISDTEMQSLWSRILAGEANAPSKFSKRTIDLISTLSKSDAAYFTKLCSAVWKFETLDAVLKFKAGNSSDLEGSNLELSFASLMHLESIGLISFDMISDFILQTKNKGIRCYYYGATIDVTLMNPDAPLRNLRRGSVTLTQAGRELAPMCGSSPSLKHMESVLEMWMADGHWISTPIGSKAQWERVNQHIEADAQKPEGR